MKITFLSLLFVSISFLTYSQESKTNIPSNKNKFTFGVYGGYNYNLNAYQETNDDVFSYDERKGGFNYGVELGYFLTNRLRPRLKLGYNQTSYYANWLQSSNIYKTKTKLQSFELDLNFDYLLINKDKFQFFTSVGLISEYVANVKYKNYEDDGDTNSSDYNIFKDAYPDASFGADFSLIAKIKLLDIMSLNISPGYNYFFNKFDSSNSNPYQRFSGNIGIEWTF